MRCEQIGGYTVFLDQTYYISYAGGSRELPKKQQSDWDKTNQLPGLLQIKERNKLGMDGNPNVVPIKGVKLISFFKELGFVPFFDRAFASTGVLQLTDVFVFEKLKASAKQW